MGPKFPRRLICILLLLLASLVGAWQVYHQTAWVSSTAIGFTGAIAVGILACFWALWTGHLVARRWVAVAFLLLAGAAILLGRYGLLPSHVGDGPSYPWFLIGFAFVSALGTARRNRNGRWLAIAGAAASAASSWVNLIWLYGRNEPWIWSLVLGGVGGAAVLFCLLGNEIAATDQLSSAQKVWEKQSAEIKVLRWAVVAAFFAVPMLFVYGWVQVGAAAGVAQWTPWVGGLLLISTWLTSSGRSIGVLGLFVSGLLVGALCIALLFQAGGLSVNLRNYYLPFWSPAALLSMAAGLRLLPGLARLICR